MRSSNPGNIQLQTWLAAVAVHDAAIFRQLYDATSPKLFGFLLRILQKSEWAEEVLQETYVSIWNNATSYQPALAAPLTWMTTIARNKAFDALRRHEAAVEIDAEGPMQDVMQALENPEPGPLAALELSSEAEALAHCLRRLEALHRQAIALAYYHDLSHSEIAVRMALPIGTVKTWIRRGLERLRMCLSNRSSHESP
jgi:RNA polymerase sigma-70 factor (ECF subfamily)